MPDDPLRLAMTNDAASVPVRNSALHFHLGTLDTEHPATRKRRKMIGMDVGGTAKHVHEIASRHV